MNIKTKMTLATGTCWCSVVFHAVRCNITGRECLYTDGGILDQYPIHCFDRTYLTHNLTTQLLAFFGARRHTRAICYRNSVCHLSLIHI